MKEGIWFSETHSEGLVYLHLAEELLYSGRTQFQRVDIARLPAFGLSLFLDGKIQSAEVDEFVYHEMLVHPGMAVSGAKRVYIMGGGEGATLREVLRHPVERVVMVDIDRELVELCKKYMPQWSEGAFDDPRAEVVYGDARAWLEEHEEEFDLVISDLTEPVPGGPSIPVYSLEFFRVVYERLSEGGAFVLQAGSADPLYPDFAASLLRTLREVFPVVGVYTQYVFSFQLEWAFVLATKGRPLVPEEFNLPEGLRHYSPEIHRRAFALPLWFKKLLEKKGRLITDERPFVWTA